MDQPTTVRPVDTKTFAIGVLSVTAAVLLVGLILVTAFPQPAMAIGQSDRGGDYVMLTEQISNSVEAVVIIDAASRQMCTYTLDTSPKQLRLLQRGFPLDRLPGSGDQRRRNP